jgi:DNA replication protein DnaC
MTEGVACAPCRRVRRWTKAHASLAIPSYFDEASFGAPDLLASRIARGPAAIRAAEDAIAAPSVVFLGRTGSGKTTLAAATLRARLARDFDAFPHASHRFVCATVLATARAQHPLGAGEAPLVAAALAVDVLLVDDLGAPATRYDDLLAEVIMRRHEQKRATWITTWATPSEVGARFGGSIERRIFERATIVRCAESDG